MRTTVTLDPDVEAKIRELARERGISFKEAINGILRAGLGQRRTPKSYRLPILALGLRAGIDLDKALAVATALEDEATLAKLDLRK